MAKESPDDDPLFYCVYALFLPTCLLAILTNATILSIILTNRLKLLRDNLDRVVAALLSVCLLWSSTSTLRYIGQLIHSSSPVANRFIAIHGSLGILLLLFLNFLLAVERFVVLGEIRGSRRSTLYVLTVFIFVCLVSLVMVAFWTSDVPDVVQPDSISLVQLDKTLLYSLLASAIFIISLTMSMYITTYRNMTHRLRASLLDEDDRIRLVLERKIMSSCLIMSATGVVCYLPAVVVAGMATVVNDVNSPGMLTARGIAGELVLLDLLVTPAMVVFFQTALRAEVFSRIMKPWFGRVTYL